MKSHNKIVLLALFFTIVVFSDCFVNQAFAASCQTRTAGCRTNDINETQCCNGGGTWHNGEDCSGANLCATEEGETGTQINVDMGEVTGNDAAFNYNDRLLLRPGGEAVAARYESIFSIVNLVVKYLYIAAGLVFFALILTSGYRLVFMGDKQKAWSSVKSNLTTGVIGLIIMFAVYWIIAIIEKLTGLNII